MNNAAQQQPQTIQFPSKEETTFAQVRLCLSIINLLQQSFMRSSELSGGPSVELPPQLAKPAAEVTYTNACARLDEILGDKSRWTLDDHNSFMATVNEAHSENMRFLRAQTAAATELGTPHYQYRPTLMRMSDGNWAAFIGNFADLEQGITGIGPSPAEAVLAFDAAFAGQLTPFMQAWIAQHQAGLVSTPKIINETQSTKPKRRSNKQPPQNPVL